MKNNKINIHIHLNYDDNLKMIEIQQLITTASIKNSIKFNHKQESIKCIQQGNIDCIVKNIRWILNCKNFIDRTILFVLMLLF